jgi:esterase
LAGYWARHSILPDMTSITPVQLIYDEFGDPNHPDLIIVHGFFASSRNWRGIAKMLAERFHVWVIDMRNHGASPHADEMDYPAMAADLAYFIEQHALIRPHILGHSMGGKAVMWLALNQPQLLGRLIVADISPTSYEHSFTATIQALKSLPVAKINNRKEADVALAASISEDSYRQFLLQNLQLIDGVYDWRVDLDIFQQTADNIVAFPSTQHISPYVHEALFLGGGNSDFICDVDVYKSFPHAQIKKIPGTGHWLHVQAPAEFCAEVIAFLE